MKYFSYYPQIKYGNHILTNITKRVKILENLETDPMVYSPYTIADGEKPEDIALFYYGSVAHTWLVYLSNKIVDPYHDWILSHQDFEKYLMDKYANESKKFDYDIIEWARTAPNHYVKKDTGEVMTKDTYDLSHLIEGFSAADWKMISVYDYEFAENEKKRVIRLVNVIYLPQVTKDLETMINE